MQFVFWTGNHNDIGQRSLEDIIDIMGCQLSALGHRVVYNKDNANFVGGDSGINIIIEGFTPGIVGIMAQKVNQGARFIILATEEPTPKGFNHGTQKEMIARQAIFPEAAKYCEGILHLVPGEHVTSWYSQFAPSAYAELGYSPMIMRLNNQVSPDYEFGFYGSGTPRRLKILKRLAKIVNVPKGVKTVFDFKTKEERDQQMRRAKVIVQIRKFEEMGLVSSSRCITALSIGRPVVAEPHDLSRPWDEVIKFSKSMDGFFDSAMIARAAWRGVYADQIDKLKRKLSPEFCIGRALDQLGVLNAKKAAA